jgi:hypothetical protein
MRRPYVVWTCNFLAIAVLALGTWWLIVHMAEMPDFRLVSGLAALTCLALNHWRWWRVACEAGDPELAGKIDYLMTANYLVLLLAFGVVEFHR